MEGQASCFDQRRQNGSVGALEGHCDDRVALLGALLQLIVHPETGVRLFADQADRNGGAGDFASDLVLDVLGVMTVERRSD